MFWLEEKKKIICKLSQSRGSSRLPQVKSSSHQSSRRCCSVAGNLSDTDTAAHRRAGLQSEHRQGRHRCVGGPAEADRGGCRAGRHRRYDLEGAGVKDGLEPKTGPRTEPSL